LYDDDNESVVFLWKRLNNNHLQQFQLPQFAQGNIVSQNERPVCVDIMESTLVSLKITGSSSSSSIYTVKSKITQSKKPGPPEHKAPQLSTSIPLVTYNALAGESGFESGYEAELSHADPNYRAWDKRKAIVLTELMAYDNSIIALQETTDSMLKYITKGLGKKYDVCFHVKMGGEYDGSAIIFDNERFELIDSMYARLLPNYSQIVVNVVLLDRWSGRLLCISNLHLKSGYGDKENVRKRQLVAAQEKTDVWLKQHNLLGNAARVVCGDLNSDRLQKWSSVSKYMTVTQQFTDVVLQFYADGDFVTYDHWQNSIFDYVFARGIAASSVYIPTHTKPGPNQHRGSDHIPVYVTLEWS
jgi:exonuclease III